MDPVTGAAVIFIGVPVVIVFNAALTTFIVVGTTANIVKAAAEKADNKVIAPTRSMFKSLKRAYSAKMYPQLKANMMLDADALLKAKDSEHLAKEAFRPFEMPLQFAVLLSTECAKNANNFKLHAFVDTTKGEIVHVTYNSPFMTNAIVTKRPANGACSFNFDEMLVVDLKGRGAADNDVFIKSISIFVEVDSNATNCNVSIGMIPIGHIVPATKQDLSDAMEVDEDNNCQPLASSTEALREQEERDATINENSNNNDDDDDERAQARKFVEEAVPDDLYLIRYTSSLVKPCKLYAMCRVEQAAFSNKWTYTPLRTGFVEELNLSNKHDLATLAGTIKSLPSSSTFKLLDETNNEIKATQTTPTTT